MEGSLLSDVFPDWKENQKKEHKKRPKKPRDPSLRYLDPDSTPNVDPDRPAMKKFEEVEPFEPSVPVTPAVPGPSEQIQATNRPKYFGAGDDEEEAFTDVIGSKPMTSFDDTTKNMPSPSLEDAWKPLTPAGGRTAFFQYLAPPPLEKKRSELPKATDDLSKQINNILQRLDQLEKDRKEYSQAEILLFIGSGLVLLVTLDMVTRH